MDRRAGSLHRFRKLWLGIGWLLVGLVAYLSLVSGPLPIDDIARDKTAHRLVYGVAHVLAYGTLMLWFLQVYPGTGRSRIASALIGLGIVLEGLQALTPDRMPGYGDVAANTVGVFLGWRLGKTRLAGSLGMLDRTLGRLLA